MPGPPRRHFLEGVGSAVLTSILSGSAAATQPAGSTTELTVEAWMDEWMKMPRAPGEALHLTRFAEPVYVLTKPIGWKPNPGQGRFAAVQVPAGFVTDFASIPRPFWWALRPDGIYTYPAIVHDYLYWTQVRTREEADEIFRFGMEDFMVSTATVTLIYNAVRLGGGAAWEANAALKGRGERRVLRHWPDDPRVRWGDWKRRPEVFAP